MTDLPDNWPQPERVQDEDLVQTGVLPPRRRHVETTEVYAPAPPGRRAADRIGYELGIGLAILAVAGVAVAIWLLVRDHGSNAGGTTTVVVTTARPAPAAGATPSAVVAMPSLVGSTRSDAAPALRDAGLRTSVHAVPNAAPAGTVLAQNPPPGTHLTRGATARLRVSSGPAPVAAKEPATTTTPAATTAAATTTPATTTTARTSTPGPASAQVPSLSGGVKSAVQDLAGRGLLASLQYVPGEASLGTVTAQSPRPDTSTQTGAHVTLSLSSGPGQKEQESVPDVVGQRIPAAVQTLNGAGLRLILLKRTVTDQSQAGTIVEQTPKPGASAPKNAQVLVYMGAFKG